MCGIIGIWGTSGANIEKMQISVTKALQQLSHRGPDDQGVWTDLQAGIVFGHRRLSIIDLSDTGHQPMLSRNGRYCLTYNGEIYNYLELREFLLTKEVKLRGASDTEILLALFVEEGPESLQRLRGMFALAIWDREEKQLFLARDRIGKKPLYYFLTKAKEFIFSSELNALAVLAGDSELTIDLSAVDSFLSDGVIGGTQTIYKSVYKLLPGHFAYVNKDGWISTQQYWRINWEEKKNISFSEAVERTDFLLQRAVCERLRADVPVGVFLSGGIDSGLITALASINCNKPIKTISIGFRNGAFDERRLARQVSEKYQTDHEEFVVEHEVALQLPSIIQSYGEPFGDASAIPSYFVSKIAAQQVKVVLNGDGGDELFLGYRRYIAASMLTRLDKFLPDIVKESVSSIIQNCLPTPKSYRSRYAFVYRLLRAATKKDWEQYRILGSDGFSIEEKKKLYRDPSIIRDNSLSFSMQHLNKLTEFDSFNSTVALDFEFSLPDALLVKMDIASMANSIEARSPFLDHTIAEFAFSLTRQIKLPGVETKPILRALAEKYLPQEVVIAPKRGFEVPMYHWLHNDLQEMRDDFILNKKGIVTELFNRSYLESLLGGRVEKSLEPSRWVQLVWYLLVIAIWDHQRKTIYCI
ncbi:MAG: asparagine synthase (glutamine-hydrolyzing) [Candidatus Scalindua rubra]|uniref:asparagine synthase (glutamine-hydrolyzing) n=1 Tax=Candidatus Scalindua brodae TaxID=237368 RepID=A0A0B0EN10_9BACT|nr:MAG: asparagine synthase [Candidatus Scalindua brodae]MBZ0108993.1 asparagine synthase (glutamine-hydrolyzing) [Candidatus Scalindua rubra]